jgi:hypothetical protein
LPLCIIFTAVIENLVALIKQEIAEEKSGIKYSGEKDITLEYFQDKEINYKDYRKIDDGILFQVVLIIFN